MPLAISFMSGTQSGPSISSVACAIIVPGSNSFVKRTGRSIITSVIYCAVLLLIK